MADAFTTAAKAIAAAVGENTGVGTAKALPPATLTVDTAIVSPAPEWGTIAGQNFCDAAIRWEIILVAPHADYAAAFVWFHKRLAELAAAFDTDPTLGGVVDGCAVESWSQPQLVKLAGGDGIAVFVRLIPMHITE